jgi:prepilin-type processing-associated H-X9-DG protein
MSLLLPAIQKVREAANKMMCGNNLKQVGIALHHYHDSYHQFPTNVRPPAVNSVRQRWVTGLLPFFEEQGIFKDYDPTLNWSDPANRAAVATRIRILECPSSEDPLRRDGAPETNWQGIVAISDYAGIYGVDPRLKSLGLVDEIGEGAVSKTQAVRFADVRDGASNTIHATESAGRPNLWRAGRQVGSAPGVRVNGGGWCRPASEIPMLVGSSADGTVLPGPCGINCTNGQEQTAYPDPIYGVDGTGQIYAFHPAGANALFVDGSVQFLQKKMDIRLLAKLVTRAAGEVVAVPDE